MSRTESHIPDTRARTPDLPASFEVPLGAGERGGKGDTIHGFGRLWRKAHTVQFNAEGVTPADVIRVWRENFGEFWPAGNRMFAPLGRLSSGEVAVLDLEMPGGARLATGIFVLYADDETFTLMTPHGHMFAGWITFSAFARADGIVARAEIVMRASDPAFEVGLESFGHRRENRFWEQTMRNLARHFGSTGEPETRVVLLDRRRQWKYARNLWHNSAIRSVLHLGLAPIRRMSRRVRRGQRTSSDLPR